MNLLNSIILEYSMIPLSAADEESCEPANEISIHK